MEADGNIRRTVGNETSTEILDNVRFLGLIVPEKRDKAQKSTTFPRWKEICSTPLSQCNRIGEEFNFKSVREKSDERYGFNRSRKTMPGSDGVDTPGRSY